MGTGIMFKICKSLVGGTLAGHNSRLDGQRPEGGTEKGV